MTNTNNQTKIFINYSNHPHINWTKEQLEAANALMYGEIGEIIDIPFPVISPNLSSKEIEQFAMSEFLGIIEKYPKETIAAIHIMGEQSFCFVLIQHFLKIGVKALCSTTERVVEEKDGKKISIFKFVQFREYKLILT